jgi:hypothetical protein
VIVVLADDGVVIVLDGPLTCVQVPLPTPGVLPAIVTVLEQIDWSPPAFAVVGLALRVTTTWSLLGEQEPLVIVHW